MFVEPAVLCLYREPHSPKIDLTDSASPLWLFSWGDPLCAEVHGWIIGGIMVNTGKKFIGPLFVVLLLPWFSDTIEGILYMVRLSVYGGRCRESFKQSDPWCRCSSDSAASQGFSYGPVADVQWLMRDSWNPPVFPVGCFPFFLYNIHYPMGKAISYLRLQTCRSGSRLGIAVHRQVVTEAFGAFPRAEGFSLVW